MNNSRFSVEPTAKDKIERTRKDTSDQPSRCHLLVFSEMTRAK